MKKCCLLCAVILLFLSGNSYGFDVKGLQPSDPYGIFSTFSAESLSKGKFAFSTVGEVSVHPDFYRVALKSAYGLSERVELEMTAPYQFGSGRSRLVQDIRIHRAIERID